MIQSTVTGQFGVGVNPGQGIVIKMIAGVENELLIPFEGDALLVLIKEAVKGLTDEQKRELVPHLTGGIVLPNIPGNGEFKPGPQG